MIHGVFVGNSPLIRVAIGSRQSVQTPFVILDTGFTGDLQVTPDIANELELEVIGVTRAQIANGEVIDIPVAQAIAAMEGVMRSIEVLIADGMPLVGINFLTKFCYTAILDCKEKTITLARN